MWLSKLRLEPSLIFNEQNDATVRKESIVRGSLSLYVSQAFSFGLSLVNAIVLARLLTPYDYGIIGMATVFINFLVLFKDAGLATATIQNERITENQISTLFWINLMLSVSLGAILLISGPILAVFYKKPELAPVITVLSLTFILSGLTIQHNALLQRHLKFYALSLNEIIAQGISLLVAILMALNGFRYWSLVGGTMARSLVLLGLTFYYCPWVPGRMEKGTGVRKMLSFGGHLTGSYFVGYLSRNLDSLLIGKVIGAEALGLYSRAFTLLMQPLTQIRGPLSNLSLPVLSTLRTNPLRYYNYFGKLLDISISLALPITVYCFLEGEFIILTLLGPKWIEAVPLFKVFSIGGIFVATSAAPGLLITSFGYTKRYFKLSVITAAIVAASFIIGVPFGVLGVAIAYSVSSLIKMIPLTYYGIRNTPVNIGLFVKSVYGPLLASGAAGLLTIVFLRVFQPGGTVGHIIAGLIFFLIYTFITLMRDGTRETFLSIWRSVFTNQKV